VLKHEDAVADYPSVIGLNLLPAANQDPRLARVFSTFSATTP